jgi:hypothetical protein
MKHVIFTIAVMLGLTAATQAQTLPSYLPTDGLVGWWPFNGNANDESGNGNDGTVNNVNFSTDRFGNTSSSANFPNGNLNSEIIIGEQINPDEFTVSLWAQPTGIRGEGFHTLISRINQYDASSTNNFHLALDGSPTFLTGGALGNTSNNWISVGSSISVINEWDYYVISYHQGVARYFVNGIINDSVVTTYNNSTSILAIGDRHNAPNYEFNYWGDIDDIAIYNRALTQEEVTALYTGEPINPPTACNPLPTNLHNGLVGYWPFCGNANDESGNGNDGTVNGATLTEDRFGVIGNAYSFNGINNSISVTDNSNLDILNSISISCWFKKNNFNNKYELLIGKEGAYNGNQCNYKIQFAAIDNNLAFFTDPRGQSGCYNQNNCLNLLNTVDWFHVVGVSRNDSMFFYLNGNLVWNSLTLSNQELVINDLPLMFGKAAFSDPNQPTDSFLHYDGQLDDIGIWNRALTADEVQQLYTLNACTFTVYDTTHVTIYDTVSVLVSTTDTLIINTLITSVEPAQENTFLVYPNPASTQITINNGNVGILGGYTMRIANSAGQEVYNQSITQAEVTLDLSNWGGNGLYILYINDPSNNTIAVKQIILQ